MGGARLGPGAGGLLTEVSRWPRQSFPLLISELSFCCRQGS